MSAPEDPFDNTVWDPVDPEQAVQDSMHGPDAVFDMLQTPPMPLGDGTYYQTGGESAVGTSLFDANGLPVDTIIIGRTSNTAESTRRSLQLREWLEAVDLGQAALTDLEARRQRQRLEERGVAYSFKPSDVCAGGSPLDECDTATTMFEAAKSFGSSKVPGEGKMWNTLSWLSRTCGNCALQCEVAVQTEGGLPTGITRLANTRPSADDGKTIIIQLEPYDR